MLYILFLGVIAFRDEELAYPWTYAAILGLGQAIWTMFFGATMATAVMTGAVVFVYLGVVFLWLSRQTRFSLLWWVAFFFATLPITGRYLLGHALAVHRP